jgi:hypothetical protein
VIAERGDGGANRGERLAAERRRGKQRRMGDAEVTYAHQHLVPTCVQSVHGGSYSFRAHANACRSA